MCLSWADVVYHHYACEKCYSWCHPNSLGLKLCSLWATGIQSKRDGNQLLHHRASHQTQHSKGTWKNQTLGLWYFIFLIKHWRGCGLNRFFTKPNSGKWWVFYLWKHGDQCRRAYREPQGRRMCKDHRQEPPMSTKQRPFLTTTKKIMLYGSRHDAYAIHLLK